MRFVRSEPHRRSRASRSSSWPSESAPALQFSRWSTPSTTKSGAVERHRTPPPRARLHQGGRGLQSASLGSGLLPPRLAGMMAIDLGVDTSRVPPSRFHSCLAGLFDEMQNACAFPERARQLARSCLTTVQAAAHRVRRRLQRHPAASGGTRRPGVAPASARTSRLEVDGVHRLGAALAVRCGQAGSRRGQSHRRRSRRSLASGGPAARDTSRPVALGVEGRNLSGRPTTVVGVVGAVQPADLNSTTPKVHVPIGRAELDGRPV